MYEILSDYVINPQTCTLLPARNIEYDTIVIEGDKHFLVKKTAIQLIKEACLRYGSSYKGRRKSVIHQTGYKRKTPFPISISRDIYIFPTHATNDHDCAWIFPNHVQFTQRIQRTNPGDQEKSMIVFNNGLELRLDVSHYVIEKQMERAEVCRGVFMEECSFR